MSLSPARRGLRGSGGRRCHVAHAYDDAVRPRGRGRARRTAGGRCPAHECGAAEDVAEIRAGMPAAGPAARGREDDGVIQLEQFGTETSAPSRHCDERTLSVRRPFRSASRPPDRLVVRRDAGPDEAVRHWQAVEHIDADTVGEGLLSRFRGVVAGRPRADYRDVSHAASLRPLPRTGCNRAKRRDKAGSVARTPCPLNVFSKLMGHLPTMSRAVRARSPQTNAHAHPGHVRGKQRAAPDGGKGRDRGRTRGASAPQPALMVQPAVEPGRQWSRATGRS